jgi:type I restriction enzyme S subunit
VKADWLPFKLGQMIQLEYGKPLPDEHRDPQGAFPVYGANGEKARTNRFYFDQPSIIVGRKGSAGELNLTGQKFWPLDVTYFVDFDRQKFDRMFLFYLLSTLELPKLAKGVKPGINREEVYALNVMAPQLQEQRRIVAILDKAFAAIATATANAEKNAFNARALFASYVDSVFSEKSGDWPERTLEEISVEFGRGKSKHRPRNDPKLYGGRYPFIQTGDIRNADHLITNYDQTYNEAGLSQSKLWPKGTVCITIAANIAETGILGFEACFPDSVIGLVVNPEKGDNQFIEYTLQHFRTDLQAAGQGSAQANINMATFADRRFPFPDVQTQREIVRGLDALRLQTRSLEALYEKKLDALTTLKQTLLDHVFRGPSPSLSLKEAAE